MKSLLTKIISVFTIFTLCVGMTACKTNKCADGHTWKLTSTTATCFEGGIENYKCEVCGTTNTENVSAYGHDLVQSSYTAPTCKTTGERVDKCSRCGFESKQTLLVIDHDWKVKSTVPSSCTVKGSQTLECSMCHETKTETLPLTDHDYRLANTTESTCITHGLKQYICNDCGDTYSEELPFAEHTYKTETKEATCFTHGGTVEKCSVCGDEKAVTETPIHTHEFGADGYCEHCGIYETLFDIDKLNGTYTFVTSLGVVNADLVPKFKNNNGSIPDSYWVENIVTLKISIYDKDEDLLGETILPSKIDNNGKLTIQSNKKVEFRDDKANKIFVRLQSDEVFSPEILQQVTSYKFEISCQGYKAIEKAYEIAEAQ